MGTVVGTGVGTGVGAGDGKKQASAEVDPASEHAPVGQRVQLALPPTA